MPWQPMHMAFLVSPALASPLISWAMPGTVTQETATANIVVNSLIILRAQSGGNSSYKTTAHYIWARTPGRPVPDPHKARLRNSGPVIAPPRCFSAPSDRPLVAHPLLVDRP